MTNRRCTLYVMTHTGDVYNLIRMHDDRPSVAIFRFGVRTEKMLC